MADNVPGKGRPQFSAREKMREAQREVGQREWVYRKKVDAGTMKQADADRQLELMREIALDYGQLAQIEEAGNDLLRRDELNNREDANG